MQNTKRVLLVFCLGLLLPFFPLHFAFSAEDPPIVQYPGTSRKDFVDKNLGHTCLEIDDRNAFIKKCEIMEVEILKVPKGESLLVFVRDYDGNFFEIKEKMST